MKTSTPLLAIYDEKTLTRQLLHHQIEQLGFGVAFSCSKKKTLLDNLKLGTRPSVLLVNADGIWKKILPLVKEVKDTFEKTEILVYVCSESTKIASEFRKAGAKEVIVSCSIEKMVEWLDRYFSTHSAPQGFKVTTDISNPFHSIVKNRQYMIILRGLAKGLSEARISVEAGIAVSSVKTYKKRMKDETKCETSTEMVALAKDYKII